jgi:predicted lipoprotein with Yx(FWY)xxD motif
MTRRIGNLVVAAALPALLLCAGCGGSSHTTSTAPRLSVASHAKVGRYLVDAGRTLYMYPPDRQRAVTCTKTEDCDSAWPPLFVTAGQAVQAGSGVDKALIGSMPGDGGRVVTYNGWPLYYYTGDTRPGQINGQDQGFNWFVISPAGRPVRTSPLSPS